MISKLETLSDLWSGLALGARRGLVITLNNILPGLFLAFALIQALTVSGAVGVLGRWCAPLMSWWDLPGEAAIVLVTSVLSQSGAAGVLVGLVGAGLVSPFDATVLMPAMYLCGALIQFSGRVLGVIDVPRRWWPLLMLLCFVNAALSMSLMRALLNWFG